jgi:hypothetical protein
MLRRPATRIELKIEDIEEFEKMQQEKGHKKQEIEDRSKLSVDQRIGIKNASGGPQKRTRSDD